MCNPPLVKNPSQGDLGGCHWIPWESSLVRNLPDPTRVFSILCVTIITVVYLYSHEWNVSALLWGLYLNPYVVGFFGTAVAVAFQSQRHASAAPLAVYDRWAAEWYWWNAWLFHAVMDGSSGTFRVVPVVVYTYDMLDLRFPQGHVVPWIIGLIEIVAMYPLCLATCYAVWTKSPYRFPLELITASIQFMGMIVFVGAEVYEGQTKIPALDPVGTENGLVFRMNLYHFVYYWFGFWFCNLIWGVVPYYRICRAVAECHRVFRTLPLKEE